MYSPPPPPILCVFICSVDIFYSINIHMLCVIFQGLGGFPWSSERKWRPLVFHLKSVWRYKLMTHNHSHWSCTVLTMRYIFRFTPSMFITGLCSPSRLSRSFSHRRWSVFKRKTIRTSWRLTVFIIFQTHITWHLSQKKKKKPNHHECFPVSH